MEVIPMKKLLFVLCLLSPISLLNGMGAAAAAAAAAGDGKQEQKDITITCSDGTHTITQEQFEQLKEKSGMLHHMFEDTEAKETEITLQAEVTEITFENISVQTLISLLELLGFLPNQDDERDSGNQIFLAQDLAQKDLETLLN